MPRTEITERILYKFDELDDKAKDRAREWYREVSSDDDFHEFVYEDAATIGELMGLDIRQRRVNTIGGNIRYEPDIFYSGFWSQGDGACFQGRWEYKPDALQKVKEHAPLDEKLHNIAADLADPKLSGLYANIVHRGNYYHEYMMDIDVSADCDTAFEVSSEIEEHVKEALRDFARWIYKMLEAEYYYQNSNEVVDENIIANEYEFTEDGHRA